MLMKHSNKFSIGLTHNLFWFSLDMAQFPRSFCTVVCYASRKKKIFEEVTLMQCSAGELAQRLGEDAQISEQTVPSVILSLTRSLYFFINISH